MSNGYRRVTGLIDRFVLVGVSPGNANLNRRYIKTKRKENEKGREEEWKPCGGLVLLFGNVQLFL